MNFKKPEFSLGWELEACQGAVIAPEGIELGYDGSVNGEHIEYRIEKTHVNSIETSISILQKLMRLKRLKIDSSCGFHVHIGLKAYPKSFPGFPGLWAAWCVVLAKEVEKDIFECVPESRKNNRHCKKWYGIYVPQGVVKQRYPSNKYDAQHRYQWLNITEMFRSGGLKTVEVRLMGDTDDYLALTTWIALLLCFSYHAYSLIYDPSRLDHVIKLLREQIIVYKNYFSTPTKEARTIISKKIVDECNHLLRTSIFQFNELNNLDTKAPSPNTSSTEEKYRYEFHRNVCYRDERRNSGIIANIGIKGCKCDSCNYYFYATGKNKKKNNVVLDDNSALDEVLGRGQIGRIEGVGFAQNPPLAIPVTPPSSLTTEEIRRAMEGLNPYLNESTAVELRQQIIESSRLAQEYAQARFSNNSNENEGEE